MEERGLLFIPDISGFTRFVSRTELDHSRRIIQELLELLINANQLGLDVSEIEGDAVLFYRFGEAPRLDQVYQQVETMFCSFHRHLLAYDQHRYCYCRACTAVRGLTLKVVTHYGEFTGYQVGTFHKLIGTAVIVAHQLLKTDIAPHEYWLVTAPLAGQETPLAAGLAPWMQWTHGGTHTESGELSFHYTQLGPLRADLRPEPSPQLGLASKTRVLSLSREYDTNMRTLLHATADFHYRSRWQEGVRTAAQVGNLLPRVGMKCRCVMDDGPVILYASSYAYSPDKVVFSETDEKKESSTYFTLEKTGEKKTRLTIDVYLKKSRARQAWFALTRRARMHERYRQSLLNLEGLAKEIMLPGCA